MVPVNSFQYRLPRFPINFPFPLLFVVGSQHIPGHCLNLSDTGLLAEFTIPVAAQAEGLIHLQPAGYSIDVHCSIAHSEGFRAGLLFAFASREQEQLLRALVRAIAEAPAPEA